MNQRKNIKKIGALFLFSFLLFAFFACGEAKTSSEPSSPAEASGTSASEIATEEAPTEEETLALPAYKGGHSLALPEKEEACESFTVVIDAGHGQRDPGNLAGEIKEADINLALSLRLASMLSEMGYRVLLTRDDDSAMLGADPHYDTDKEAEARRKWAVEENADLYISIHCNAASDENARGVRLFYNSRPVTVFEGRPLAGCYQRALNTEFASEIKAGTNPEVKHNHVNGMEEDIYIVLQDVRLPALLIEIGFMTNESDLALLLNDDYLWEYAHALAVGTDEARKNVLSFEK